MQVEKLLIDKGNNMSRHILKSDSNIITFVGWDNPLQTFFAQTYKNYNQPEEELIWWVGDKFSEFSTPGKFVQKLEQSGFEIAYGVYELLKKDFSERKELSPLQQFMKEMFDKVQDNQ